MDSLSPTADPRTNAKVSGFKSPFSHVLYTNYAPNEADAQKIRDFCVAPEKEIEKLELEISRLEATLNAVRNERDVLRDTVTAHRALLSPIRRLSSELLQDIFVSCLTEFPVMHVSEAPLLLGRVCKIWRDVTYNTAELWSAVHIAVPSMSHLQHRALRLEALEEWLSRSGNHTLRISLCANYEAGDIAPFLDLIISISQRWERIALVLPQTCFDQLAQSFSGGQELLHLRTIQLSDRLLTEHLYIHAPPLPGDYSTGSIDPLRLLNLCPKIQRISIFLSSTLSLRPLLPSSVAASLQELDVDNSTIFNHDLNQLFSFLTGCQTLRKLRITTSFYESALPAPYVTTTLPMLEYLMVNMINMTPSGANPTPLESSPVLTFLNHLVTPKLLYLEIPNAFEANAAAVSLNSLFARSLCSLRTLSLSLNITDTSQDLQPLLSCLEYANDLRELTIDHWNFLGITNPDDTLLAHLAYTTDGGINCCPNLTHLKLINRMHGFNLTSLLTLARSRVNPPSSCASLEVLDLKDILLPTYVSPSPPFVTWGQVPDLDSFLKSVEELREQGLKVLLPPNLLSTHPLVSPWCGLPTS